jgi:hypothetical protein
MKRIREKENGMILIISTALSPQLYTPGLSIEVKHPLPSNLTRLPSITGDEQNTVTV